MSKIINTPKQCGWRHMITTRLGIPCGLHTCWNPERKSSFNCNSNDVFPEQCPLEDGLPKKSIHWP